MPKRTFGSGFLSRWNSLFSRTKLFNSFVKVSTVKKIFDERYRTWKFFNTVCRVRVSVVSKCQTLPSIFTLLDIKIQTLSEILARQHSLRCPSAQLLLRKAIHLELFIFCPVRENLERMKKPLTALNYDKLIRLSENAWFCSFFEILIVPQCWKRLSIYQ